MGTTKKRIRELVEAWRKGDLTDVSDIGQATFPKYRILMQTELFSLVNRPGIWLMVPLGDERPDYIIEELLTCIWQCLQFDQDFYRGGKGSYAPITLSSCEDLLVISELLLKTNGEVSKIILITLAGDEEMKNYFNF